MYFEIIDNIENVEIVAVGGRIRDIMRLRKQYGFGGAFANSKALPRFAFRAEEYAMPKYTGTKLTA